MKRDRNEKLREERKNPSANVERFLACSPDQDIRQPHSVKFKRESRKNKRR